MSDVDVPEQCEPEPSGEGSRLTTLGYRIDDGSQCLLIVVDGGDGWWTVHGPGAAGIRLTARRMAVLAGAIVVRAR